MRVRVLAVDDEPMNLELLERTLRREYEIITAESPDEALERLRREPDIAVILSDYRMPGMNGADFLAETIKTHPATRRVMITGYADTENVIAAVNSGRIDYLIKKPFSRESLVDVLDRLIDAYQDDRRRRRQLAELRATNGKATQDLSTAGEELERVSRDLEVLAFKDAVTGLYSHRTFQERLREELARARRYQQPVSLLYGDIDEFASVNDELGYSIGDEMLRRVAELLRSGESEARLRESDVVARYGGEEFAVLLPETTRDGARIKAERLRNAIEGGEFPSGRMLTISFGLASFPEDADDPAALVRCAELALRSAKKDGRNRVHAYTPADGDPHQRAGEDAELSRSSRVFVRSAERFPSYHSRLDQIMSTLERDRTVACLFVDLSQLRRIEMEYGVAQHTELFATAGELLERLRGDKLRREDLVCRTEDADAYVCFLAPPRHDDGPPVDLEAIAARVEEEIQVGLSREMESLTRERPRVVVGFSRVLNNSMMRPERLIVRLVAEARRSAALHGERTAHRDKQFLQEIILHEQLTAVYQPIVQLASGDIFGFEALTRGPPESHLESPTALFSVADEVDLTFELDRGCFRNSLRSAIGLEPIHRLFVNLLPLSFYDASFIEKEVANLLDAAALTPANLVFEITERLAIENFVSFRQALASYTAMGFGVAIDDVGTRHSNLETVMALRPHFIKISDVLTRGVSQSTVKREMLRSLQRIAEAIDAVVVAEGIETPDDLAVLCELGVRYGQGFYLARPGPPFPRLRPTVRRAVRALAQEPREPRNTPYIPVDIEEEEEGEICYDEVKTGLHWGSSRPVEPDDDTALRAAGSSPGLPATGGRIEEHDGQSDGVIVDPSAGEETQPKLLFRSEPWKPLSDEGLGADEGDVSLLRSLRLRRPAGSEEPARIGSDAKAPADRDPGDLPN